MAKQFTCTTLRRASLLAPLAGAWLIACAETRPSDDESQDTVPSSQELSFADQLLLASAKVALPPPSIGPGDLPDSGSRGAEYLQQYCTGCHALPSPGSHSATDWPRVLRRMWLRTERIDSSYNVPVPNTGERLLLMNYLLDNALQVGSATLPPGPDREFFSTTCGQCHDLPDPNQHSAQDWRAVVRRMTDHMVPMLGTTLTPDEITRIVRYLEIATNAGP